MARKENKIMATSVLSKPAAKGGSFLLESPASKEVFTPADITDDQKLIGQTAEEFVTKEVLPLVKDLENKKPGLMAELVRKGCELGIMGGGVPDLRSERECATGPQHWMTGMARPKLPHQ